MDKILKRGTRVSFSIGDIPRTGIIVVKSLNHKAIPGDIYIIKPDMPIENEIFNFSCFPINKSRLELI